MKLVICAIIFSSVTFGQALSSQYTARFSPIRMSTVKSALGSGHLGVWKVAVCNNDTQLPLMLHRERLFIDLAQQFPAIDLVDVPNALAEDVARRSASSGIGGFFVENAEEITSITSSGLVIAGISKAKGSNLTYAGLALTGAQVLIKAMSKRRPNPAPYFSSFLPKIVSLPPNDCDVWGFATNLMPSSKLTSVLLVVDKRPAKTSSPE